MLENYQRGSFWFGTLKRYRMIEENESGVIVEPRFSDRREGMVEHAYKVETGYAKSFKVGGLTVIDTVLEGASADIMLTYEFNDFVFCASRGAYSRQQHLDIKNGAMSAAETRYEGNSKLTHFAEIDLIHFLDAVISEAPKTASWNTRLSAKEFLRHGLVEYGQTERSISIPSVYERSDIGVTTEDYRRTMFTKPKHFSPENEFRVVLRSNAPNSLEGDPAGMALMHKNLRRSIRKIGTLDGTI